MAHLVFDLSSVEAKERFRELVSDMLDITDAVSEKFLEKVADKARLIGLAHPDYHGIILAELHRRGGVGLEFVLTEGEEPAIVCSSCGSISTEIFWLCRTCNSKMLKPLALRCEILPKTYICTVTGMEFIYIKGGRFQMGDQFGDGKANETPVHEVELDDFYMGKYLVTNAEWLTIDYGKINLFKGGTDPKAGVDWLQIQEFIVRLNSQTGQTYRLPTEAEWEYAASSGGKRERWAGINDEEKLVDYAWFKDNSDDKNHPIGEKNPNGLGLYDMSGNIYEWCADWYDADYYAKSPLTNPLGPQEGMKRVLRGGSHFHLPNSVRVAHRAEEFPDYRGRCINVGFRLALSARRN